jgi:hypothetical protein
MFNEPRTGLALKYNKISLQNVGINPHDSVHSLYLEDVTDPAMTFIVATHPNSVFNTLIREVFFFFFFFFFFPWLHSPA